MNVQETYLKELKVRGYQPDEAQQRAVDRLQHCYDEWVSYKARRSNALRKMLVHPELPRGVYMWGGVGRGKSFLMDAFYGCVPVVRKTGSRPLDAVAVALSVVKSSFQTRIDRVSRSQVAAMIAGDPTGRLEP